MQTVQRADLQLQHKRAGTSLTVSGINLQESYLPRSYIKGNVVGIEMQRGGVRYVLNVEGEFKKTNSSGRNTYFVKMDDVAKAGFCQLVREQMVANRLFCEELVTDPRFSNIYAALFLQRVQQAAAK